MSARLSIAIQAFEDLQRVELLLDRKRRALNEAIIHLKKEEMPEYMEVTKKIEVAFEEKRATAGL